MSDKSIPNPVFLQTLVAIEKVLGEKGLESVAAVAGLSRYLYEIPAGGAAPVLTFDQYARLLQITGDYIGRASPSILGRIGRAWFQYGLEDGPAPLALSGIGGRLLPKRSKLKNAFNAVGNAFSGSTPDAFWVDDRGGPAFCTRECAFCEGRQAAEPVGHFQAGVLAEACKWAIGDDLRVTETMCMAKGDDYGRWEVDT